MNRIIFLFFIFFFQNTTAYAYIDPFTGAFILKAIAAAFATIIFYLGYPFRIAKKIYSKIFKKKDSKNEKS
tara:strand:- start:415 stop:627 length:213 start_codon:yes stop_codon:yes gene_type:complete